MQFFISRLFFPLSLVATVASYLHARATGGNLEMAVVVPSIAVLLAAMLLERFWPARRDWNRSRGDLGTDLTSAAVMFGVVEPMLKWLAPVALLGLHQASGIGTQGWLFPTALPFAVQAGLALMMAEFGSYWAHRLHHAEPRLWWLHALHHGSERLYALNNFRMHPLNSIITYLAGMFPLLLIGTPHEVMLGYFAVSYPVLMLQHANLDLRSGWLNYVFSTNEVHRWHHSTRQGEGDSNFGRAFVIWDMVFGTFRYRPQGNMPGAIGLYASSRYPARASFLRQVLSMFRPGCCPSPSAA